jgi:hypothetical protein
MNIIKSMNTSNTKSPASNRRLLLLRALAGAAALGSVTALTPGCVVAVRPAPVATVYAEPEYVQPGEVVVSEDPPPPIAEVVGVAPGPGFVWVGGFYHWYGGRWVWNRGHWGRPPHPGAAWVHPRYVIRGGTRVYIAGYWR